MQGGVPIIRAQRPETSGSFGPAVERLLQAGARIEGKTIPDELAFSLEGRNCHYGTPLNPELPKENLGRIFKRFGRRCRCQYWRFSRSAPRPADRFRVPASFVDVFGFRPSHRLASLVGVVPVAFSYYALGWFARVAEL